MAASLTFDYNGTPVTPILPASQLAWQRVPVYIQAEQTMYNYILSFAFRDDVGIERVLELRLYTDNISAITYDLSNQGTLTDGVDVVLSDSMYIRMVRDGEFYNVDSGGQIVVSAVTSADCDGTFSGDLVNYTAIPTINNSLPMITDPAVADTIPITNGNFTQIAILP